MLKFATTLLVVFALYSVSTQVPALGQAATQNSQVPSPAAERTDLKKVFAAETDRFKSDSAAFDAVKLEREIAKQQAQKKGWSKTKKTLVIAAVAVGVAALVFLVVKYGKECIRTEPAGCTLYTDEFCTCAEYEKRNP